MGWSPSLTHSLTHAPQGPNGTTEGGPPPPPSAASIELVSYRESGPFGLLLFFPPALPCPSPSLVLALWLLLGWWLALGTKSGQALEPGYSTSFCCPPLPLVDEKVALPCKNCLVPFHVPPCPRPSVRPSVRLAGSSNLHSSPPPLSVQRLFLLLASEIYQLWAVSTYPPPPSKEFNGLADSLASGFPPGPHPESPPPF